MEPTMNPTKEEICVDWKIRISLILSGYIKVNNWEDILSGLCLKAFKQTILYLLNEWNNDWCTNIDVEFEDLMNERRRLLQQNINIDASFYINNMLYTEFFDGYNSTKFNIEFQRILSSLMNINSNEIEGFTLNEPIEMNSESVNEPTPKPVHSTQTELLETRNHSKDAGLSILMTILSVIFGCLCCCIIGCACRLLLKNEQKLEINTKLSYIVTHATSPISPSANSDAPEKNLAMIIQMQDMNKNTKETDTENEGEKLGVNNVPHIKKTSFEINLTNNVIASDIIMNDIVNDIVSDCEEEDQNDGDDDVVDVDMTNFVMTPQ